MADTERFQLRHTEAGRLNLPPALGFIISQHLEDTSALGLLDCKMGLELLLEHREVALIFTSSATAPLHHAAKRAAVKVYSTQNSPVQRKCNCKLRHGFTLPKCYVCHHLPSTRNFLTNAERALNVCGNCMLTVSSNTCIFIFIRYTDPTAEAIFYPSTAHVLTKCPS